MQCIWATRDVKISPPHDSRTSPTPPGRPSHGKPLIFTHHMSMYHALTATQHRFTNYTICTHISCTHLATHHIVTHYTPHTSFTHWHFTHNTFPLYPSHCHTWHIFCTLTYHSCVPLISHTAHATYSHSHTQAHSHSHNTFIHLFALSKASPGREPSKCQSPAMWQLWALSRAL